MKLFKLTKKTILFGGAIFLVVSASGYIVFKYLSSDKTQSTKVQPIAEGQNDNINSTDSIEQQASSSQKNGSPKSNQQASSMQSKNTSSVDGGTKKTSTSSPPPSSSTGTTLEITSANYSRKYGSCATIIPATSSAKAQLSFNITSSCNPADDGHYRTDWSNVDTYSAGTTTCTSIPIYFPSGVPTIGSGSWWQFAEAKTPPTAYADWGLYVHNKFDGSSGTEFDLRMAWVSGTTSGAVSYGTGHPSLWHGGNPSSGWNTFVVCSNYSTTTNGFLDLYLNGTLVRSISGVAILQGQTTDDLDINDYTGGSPTNVMVHGAPMIGTTPDSVKQSGGWNSAP